MKRLLTIIVAITLFHGIARAQQFPVQVTPQLLPPYSVKVSDYYSPGVAGSKLNLLLLLRDFNKPQLQVRLRMSIEGQSVSLRSREDAVFTPITIESGTPVYVDPSELAQYFNPNNLDFSGITRQQYEQTGKLPEGFYTFCFEAIEIATNQSVSNKGCTFAWMTLNEPPILNLPRKAEGVIPINPQNIIFQWTPRHTASPTAAFITDYIFSIVEMNDNAIAPEAAFLSSPPLYIDSVTTTTFLYHAGLPALIEGKKYAWRVQAKAKNGIQDLATFRNQGYSETFWFTYQNNCAVPVGAAASPQGQRVGIEWNSNPVHLEYKVEYREANDADAVWFEIGNTLPRVSITDLKPNTAYEYRVGGACEYGRYTFGNLLSFTTNGENATTVPECGIDPNLTDPPQTLLQTFLVGDTIHAGDYDVIVTSITGQTSFSGEGYVKMSWLGDANIAVRFTNIGINTDKKLASGVIETTYDPNEEGIADAQEFVEFFKSFTELFDNIKNYTRDLTDGSEVDANKIADFTNTLGLMQSSFLDRIEDESLRQEALTDFQNLNNALESLAEGQSCECESSGGSSGGGNFYRGRFLIFSIECCKQVIDQSLSNLENAGVRVNSDIADKQNAIGNYLLAKGYYLTPIHTPLKLPANSLILKSSKYTLPGLSKPYLMRFQANNKIFEADIQNGLFYGYKTASGELYPLTYNNNDFATEPYKIYTLEQTGNCDDATIRQQATKYYRIFCPDRINDLSQGAQIGSLPAPGCGVEPDGVYENGFDVSTSGACDADLKSVDFDGRNGIVRQISKDKIDQYINGNLDVWMTEKETYGEVFIHKAGSNSIKHFTRNNSNSYNGLGAMDIAKSNFLRGDLEEDYAIWLEYDEAKGQVKIYQQFRTGYLNPQTYSKRKGGNAFGELIKGNINDKLLTFENLNQPIIRSTDSQAGGIPEDGKYETEDLWFIEWMIFGAKECGYIVNNAQVNRRLWDDQSNPTTYNKSPMNIWSPIAGGGDQALEELKDLYELVDLAGKCIQDPKIIKDLYNSVTSLRIEDIKGMIKQSYDLKRAQYDSGGVVQQYHLTRDGIKAATLIVTVWKTGPLIIKKGGDILQKLQDLIENIPHLDVKEKIRSLDELLSKKFIESFDGLDNKLLKRLKEDAFVYDDWLNSVQSGFSRIDVKRRLDQIGEYAVESINEVDLKWKKLANEIDFGDRGNLRKILSITDGTMEAHHKLPWDVCKNNRVIQEAAKDGFHPNMPENGIPLTKYRAGDLDEAGLHAYHPKYNEWVNKQLNDWSASKGNVFSPEEANRFLQTELIPDLDELIEAVKLSTKNLNDYFRDLP